MPKALIDLPDIMPEAVVKFAKANVMQGRTDYCQYVCREHSGLLVRYYAFKCKFRYGQPQLDKLQIREVMRRRTGDPGYAVRDMYYVWMGCGSPWRVAWQAYRDDYRLSGWYNANFGDNWGKWSYDTDPRDMPKFWSAIVNPQIVCEKYPYCGYRKERGWDIVNYVSLWLKNSKIEYFGKAGIYPRKALVDKAMKDKRFASYLMRNRTEAWYLSIRFINLGYKAGIDLKTIETAYQLADFYGRHEDCVIELLAKDRQFKAWIDKHRYAASTVRGQDLLDVYYGRMPEELARRRSRVREICKIFKLKPAMTIDYIERTGVDTVDYKNYLASAEVMHLDLKKKEVIYPEAFNEVAVKTNLEADLIKQIKTLSRCAQKVLNEKIVKICEYVREQHINAAAYTAYISDCVELELDLSDTKNLFPREFIRIAEEKKRELVHRKEYRKQHFREVFRQVCESFAQYQDLPGKSGAIYCMILPFDPMDLVNEGNALSHCVGRMGYDKKVVDKKSLITFLRLADAPDTPYVTCEINLADWSLQQCYGERDSKPDKAAIDYANEWVAKTKAAILNAA